MTASKLYIQSEFEHASHLDASRWRQAVERERVVPGWVQRSNVVKAVNRFRTLETFVAPALAAPLPESCSLTNLDFSMPYARRWMSGENWAHLDRVLAGKKTSGRISVRDSKLNDSGGLYPTTESMNEIREAQADFAVSTKYVSPDGQYLHYWVAPKLSLEQAINLEPIIDWLYDVGQGFMAESIHANRGLWLPDACESPAPRNSALEALINGYPLNLLKLRDTY